MFFDVLRVLLLEFLSTLLRFFQGLLQVKGVGLLIFISFLLTISCIVQSLLISSLCLLIGTDTWQQVAIYLLALVVGAALHNSNLELFKYFINNNHNLMNTTFTN